MSTDLVQIETLKPGDVFTPGGVEKLIADVECKVRATVIDTSTAGGRKEATSLAFKVTRSKTALDEMGKNFVAELKKAAGVVDADRRIIRDRLDALRDEVKRPVDEYDAAEDARKSDHATAIMEIQTVGQFADYGDVSASEIEGRVVTLKHLYADRDFEEFTDQVRSMRTATNEILSRMHKEAVTREAERAELERLRKAEAERVAVALKVAAEQERVEREERIAADAKLRAEMKAEAAQQRIEQEKADAVARAEKAEADAKDAAEKAERDRIAAAQRAEADKAAAIAAEQRRAAQAIADEEAAAKRREADIEHRRAFNGAAVDDLVNFANITKKQAQDVITAIAGGKVSNVSIRY